MNICKNKHGLISGIHKKIIINFLLSILVLGGFTAPSFAQSQAKAVWYRYYDSNGVANISSSVTQNHIRHGYEALDKNMQVIQRKKAYNVEADLKNEPKRAAQAKKNEADNKLKKAYTNSKVATQKRDAALNHIKKQIAFQNQQVKQLQNDRIQFKREEMEYTRKGKSVPENLQKTLNNNLNNINQLKKNTQTLQTNYLKTQTEYNEIINRLKAIE